MITGFSFASSIREYSELFLRMKIVDMLQSSMFLDDKM